MIHEFFPAMGTTIEVMAESDRRLGATKHLFDVHEARFSRFLPNSELSLINSSPKTDLEVSKEMGAVLSAAKGLQMATDGRVDPGIGTAMVAWGYDRPFTEVISQAEHPIDLMRGEWTIEGRRLRREAGVRFDLGGVAKGWTADRAVEEGLALLVSAGGDVRSSLDNAQVDIGDPWGVTPARVKLGRGALATSSVTKRRWRVGSNEAHHIIDPATMAPSLSPVLSATALCATATEAEAAAKTLILLGIEGLQWAESRPWVDAAMVTWHDGSVFATHGWEMAA
ncbi:MAG: FAD:protein FMN transferase [Actinomycetota bacterium]|nr:FAD:protein FMN transferase [Actinomycetota bacterium]